MMEVDILVAAHHQLRTVEHRYVDADVLRTRFALAMSNMYKAEVPLYGDLVSIVQGVNRSVLTHDNINYSVERITLERHGAIRLGSPYELQIARRIFGLLGMHPIGYYDLSIAGLPMHTTCFRSDHRTLNHCPRTPSESSQRFYDLSSWNRLKPGSVL
jgi:uncharacterized glyoxalase superfamily metalloenzyme YdcJ